MKKYDLIIRNGRLIEPNLGIDGVWDIAFDDGKVAAIEKSITKKDNAKEMDASGKIVLPGLIDLHTHIYWGATSLGVSHEEVALRSGTTTFVDAGSAGPGNFAGFRRFIAESSALQVYSFLNISYAGIFGFAPGVMVGECSDIRLLNKKECLSVAEKNRDLIRGIKVRAGHFAGGDSGIAPLAIGREVADELNLPLMAHFDHPPPGVEEILGLLREGDILTHCYRPEPNSVLTNGKQVKESVRMAKDKGILFDIGHGMGGMAFEVARTMLAEGLAPDTISSDVHQLCVNGPAYDLLHTASKFLCLGMSIEELVPAMTQNPARVLREPGLGTLASGAKADAVVLNLETGEFPYKDAAGETLIGKQKLSVDTIVIDGKIWNGAE
jgi:dihydroorotase